MAFQVGVHGFNVKNPEKTIGKLKRYIEDLYMFNYGLGLQMG